MKRAAMISIAGFILFFSGWAVAEAHVKWFTDIMPEKETITNIMSPLFMGLALFIAVLLAVLTQVLPSLSKWGPLAAADRKLDQWRKHSYAILKYGLATALIIQLITGTVFVPEFEISSILQTCLLGGAIALFLIPYPAATKAGAVVLLALLVMQTISAGWFHMLDYGFYWAIVGALLVQRTKWKDWGMPLLYLGTGLSLCWVAVEKWVFPVMTLDIIENHGVPTFGFAPETFIVMAAFIEFVVGYLLVVGILNRLLSAVLTGIFILTTMLFGMTELIGHFMIHIVLIIFIIEGVSFYKPPVEMHTRRLDQMIFVSLNFIFALATIMLIYYRFT